MKLIVLLALASLSPSTTALARTVDCSAFRHQKDGSWIVAETTRLAGVEHGVSKSSGLAPGERFSRDGKASMGGVNVFQIVERHCR